MPREFDPNDVLSQPLMANLASVTEGGQPRNAPMWFIWEEGAIWLLGSTENSSVKRLSADPHCAVEIVKFDASSGVLLHLGLRGTATIEASCSDRFHRLLNKYIGTEESWNPWFIENVARIDDPTGRMIKMVPDQIFTNNVSYFLTGPELAWPPASED